MIRRCRGASAVLSALFVFILVFAGDVYADVSLKPVRDFELGSRLSYFTLSPDADLLATVKDVGHLEVWDTQAGDLLWKHDERDANPTPVFNSDGSLLAFWSKGQIELHRANDGARLARLTGPGMPTPGHVYFSPDGRWLISTADDQVRIYSVEAARKADQLDPLQVLKIENPRPQVNPIVIRQLVITPDSARLMVRTQWAIHEWSLPSAERIRTITLDVDRISPTGLHAINCQSRQGLYPLGNFNDVGPLTSDNVTGDWMPGIDLPMQERHYGRIDANACRFSPDGTLITQWSGKKDYREFELYVWDMQGQLRFEYFGTESGRVINERIMASAFTPDSRRLITVDSAKTIRVFDTNSGLVIASNENREGIAWDKGPSSESWPEHHLWLDRTGRYFLTWANFSKGQVPGLIRLWEIDDGSVPVKRKESKGGAANKITPWWIALVLLLGLAGYLKFRKKR